MIFRIKNIIQALLKLAACVGIMAVAQAHAAGKENITILQPEGEVLDFNLMDGHILNEFYRNGKVAAHSLLSGGKKPRLITAFPAGNSAVSLWFTPTSKITSWTPLTDKYPVTMLDDKANILYGVQWQSTVDSPGLDVEQAVLSNIRVLRNYLHQQQVPDEIRNKVEIEANSVTWSRYRLDNKSSYYLRVRVLNGKVESHDGHISFSSLDGEPMQLQITALTGDTPLTPLSKTELLKPSAIDDPLSQNILAFLSYREKLLAGSWRFLTYFGRDTLMSVRLLMPVLKNAGIEAGLGAALHRLNLKGEVAHEEDIAEYALLEGADRDKIHPRYDYMMMDDNYMLLPVMGEYLLHHQLDKAKGAAFLARKDENGVAYGEYLRRNIDYVYQHTLAFAASPGVNNLIRVKPGTQKGQWRDSDEGLAITGRYAFDINAVFVPAALKAIGQLQKSGLLQPYMAPDSLSGVAEMASIWKKQAPDYFLYDLSRSDGIEKWRSYAVSQGVPFTAPQNLPEKISFYALALKDKGTAIPVLHSDIGFSLLFQLPDAARLEILLDLPMQDYPVGLLSPAGLMASNPALATVDVQQVFSRNHYHGTVIWSWHQALLLAGLDKQMQRSDLAPQMQQRLKLLYKQVSAMVADTNKVKESELWSWDYAQGQYRIMPFGQQAGHLTESNAAQLWSTVYLAL
jgi:hypothetical protein